MFKNEISIPKLRSALVAWSLGVDGNNFCISGVLDEIPWTNEMSKVCSFAEYHDRIDKVIGSRFCFIADKFCQNTKTAIDVASELYNWAVIRADEIYEQYDEIIKELNDKADTVNNLTKDTKFIIMNKESSYHLHTFKVVANYESGFKAYDYVDECEYNFADGIKMSCIKIIK